jgi:hypothetical protein
MEPKSFDQDMLKLEKAFFENLRWDKNQPYYETIGLDSKRPFGNQDMESDILEIIGAEMQGDDGEEACWSSKQRAYATHLYESLLSWLQEKYSERP